MDHQSCVTVITTAILFSLTGWAGCYLQMVYYRREVARLNRYIDNLTPKYDYDHWKHYFSQLGIEYDGKEDQS